MQQYAAYEIINEIGYKLLALIQNDGHLLNEADLLMYSNYLPAATTRSKQTKHLKNEILLD